MTKQLSKKALSLLKRIGNTEEASSTVGRKDLVTARELVSAGLAIVIPVSTGRGELALTGEGIELFEKEGGA